MKVVLDECLPKRLCRELAGHEAATVPMMGLAGIENGQLLHKLAGSCDVLVTIDANLMHQQNLGGLPFAVIVLKAATNKIEDLRPLRAEILAALEQIQPGEVRRIVA